MYNVVIRKFNSNIYKKLIKGGLLLIINFLTHINIILIKLSVVKKYKKQVI
jgi:hypothetical protein